MNIYFDHNPGWHFPAASHKMEDRTYIVAPEPYRLVVVVLHDAAYDIPHELTGNTYDCSVGWHDDHKAPVGFTLPQFRRKKHSKITVRRAVDAQPDETLGRFMDSVPKGSKIAPGAGRPAKEPSSRTDIRLPDWLIEYYSEQAEGHGVTRSALMRTALEWCAKGDGMMDSADYVAALVGRINRQP